MSSARVLFNGKARAPTLHNHPGFQYGDGVFRTCLIYDSQPIDIKQHIKKLSSDARALGMRPPAAVTVLREVSTLARGQGTAKLKIYLVRRKAGSKEADRLLTVSPATRYPASHWTVGVRVGRSDLKLAGQPELAGIKHMNRLPYVLAERSARRVEAETLVSDDRGRPLEGTRTNLFWGSGRTLFTPEIKECGVAGLARERILKLAAGLGIRTRIGKGSWASLQRAKEVFVCNSVIGIWPVLRMGKQVWSAPGQMTRELMVAMAHPQVVAR